MNIYVVGEGEIGEKKIYEKWIPYINPALRYSATISDVTQDNFYIAIGGGFPNIFQIINDAIVDIISMVDDDGLRLFDRLVVAIDSEDETLQDKYQEIDTYIQAILTQLKVVIDYKIVIQHFCLETWGLANRKLMTQNIQNLELVKYKKFFNVGIDDPELLPHLFSEGMNRAQFAIKYLRLLLNNKFRNTSYSKSNPTELLHYKYFEQVLNRHNQNHIQSFGAFLAAFI